MPQDSDIGTVAALLKAQHDRFYGKYRGVVMDNKDPRRRGRLLVMVPSVLGPDVHKWAPGQFPLGGNASEAAIFVPAIGSQVLVEFIEGSPQAPVWSGVYYPDEAEDGGDFAPPADFDRDSGTLHLIRTEQGIAIRLEDDRKAPDDGGRQRLVLRHPRGGEIVIDPDGVITLTDHEGAVLMLDPDQKIVRLTDHGKGRLEMTDSAVTLALDAVKIELTASGVTVTGGTIALDGDSVTLGKGAGSSLLNAEAFINSVFMSHTHPTAVGPSGTPVPPGAPVAAVALNKVRGA